ncbi:Colicin V secretion protein CvaA [Serratia fonticola]|uniref:Colicin V secretion protein CvaA n=2 Tax=Serratia TaxID=613 RepID=A0A4U9WC12_SERFO|nr:Colicin V secretion protein CvaA [Serratia fonticola]
MLLSSLPAKWVATFSILFILTLIAFLIFGSYTRRIQVSGEVTTQPGAMNVFSTQQGIISKRYVKTGQW